MKSVAAWRGKKIGIAALGGVVQLVDEYLARKAASIPVPTSSSLKRAADAVAGCALGWRGRRHHRGSVAEAIIGKDGRTARSQPKKQGPSELADLAQHRGRHRVGRSDRVEAFALSRVRRSIEKDAGVHGEAAE